MMEQGPERAMQYISTRDDAHRVSLSEALQRGLAPDGGLYVPERFPAPADLDLAETPPERADEALPAVAEAALRPFFVGDELAPHLPAICGDTYTFPVPLRDGPRQTATLELFHGPTAAFKDVGARFLASALSRLNADRDVPLTILVATSGDTGAAVAAAFHRKPNVEVIVLYPRGKVSERQERQLTGWDANVQTIAVRGVFDDCQRLVKAAFQDEWWQANKRLSSANSINIGRLLPQMTYYAAASFSYRARHGVEPGFIVPSGNLGNALAALYAREAGWPVREVVMATNANRPVTAYLESGTWQPFDTIETLATAMDVGQPSNMERMRYHWPRIDALRQAVHAYRVPDDAIRQQIQQGPGEWDTVWDPHTATAVEAHAHLDRPHWVFVATAHPAKFPEVVEPLIGNKVPIPDPLADVMARSKPAPEIEPTLDALRRAVVGTHS